MMTQCTAHAQLKTLYGVSIGSRAIAHQALQFCQRSEGLGSRLLFVHKLVAWHGRPYAMKGVTI